MILPEIKNSLYSTFKDKGITFYELYGYGTERILIGEYMQKSDIKTKIIQAVDITDYLIVCISCVEIPKLLEFIKKTNIIKIDISIENMSVIERKL